MPKNIEYHIGDIVLNSHMGKGIILGQHVHPEKGNPIYHVYFYDYKIYKYAFSQHITFVSDATPDSIQEAQNLILTMQNKSEHHAYVQGDIIHTILGDTLVLDNGHKIAINGNDRVYYHIATDKNEHLYYIETREISGIVHPANDESIKRAKRIIMEKILMPTFNIGPE